MFEELVSDGLGPGVDCVDDPDVLEVSVALGDGLAVGEVVSAGDADAALVSLTALANTTFVGTSAQLGADVALAIAPVSIAGVV